MASFIDVLMFKYDPNDWVINGTSYEDVTWLGSGKKPSLAVLNSFIDEVDDLLRFSSLRDERNRRLLASDWTQIPDAPVDAKAWAAYRQALRDLPATIDDPTAEVEWPTPPE